MHTKPPKLMRTHTHTSRKNLAPTSAMANEKEANLDEQEKKIPVFTVLKNNTILKNIFVIGNPPSISELNSNRPVENGQENEEILVVGRHPDCNITLEHPSISRFHLRIHSNPPSQMLSVVDLSSVHGTWISGKKIEPGVRVELKEGDTMRMGGSSRVYKLHWIPLDRAYDQENPFISPLDALAEGKEEEDEEEDAQQDENRFLVENNQIGSLCCDFEAMDSLFSEENSDWCLKKSVPSAPPLPEYMKFSFSDEGGNKNPLWNDAEHIENEQFEKEKHNHPRILDVSEVLCESINPDCFSEIEPNLSHNLSPSFSHEEFGRKNHEEKEISSPSHQPFTTESADSCLASRIVTSTTEDQQFEKEKQVSQLLLTTGLSRREHSNGTPIRSEQKHNLSDGEEGRPVAEILEVIEKPSPLRKDHEQTDSLTLWSGAFTEKSAIASKVLSEIGNQQSEEQNQTPPIHFASGVSGREATERPLVKSKQKGVREIEKVLSEAENQQSEEENEAPQTHFASGVCGREDSESPTIKAEPKGVFEIENQQSDKENQTPQTHFASGVFGREDQESTPIKSEQKGIFEFENVLSEIENQQSDNENQIPQTHCASGVFVRRDPESPLIKSEHKSSLAASIWSRRGKATCSPHIQTGRSRGQRIGVDINVEYETLDLEDIGNNSISKTLFANLDGDEEEIFTPDKENFTPNTILTRSMKKMSNTEETLKQENVGSNSISQKLFTNLGGDEEETFTPDKENFAPNTLLVRSMKKVDKAIEIRHSKSRRLSSLKNIVDRNTRSEENRIPFTDKENQTQKVLQEQKLARPTSRNRAILEPEVMVLKSRTQIGSFQHLHVSSTEKNNSETSVLSATMRNSNSVNYGRTIQNVINPSGNNSTRGERQKWNMVVDSTCLLNKKSRKALQLLQGVKGTQLIIPRIVIRELDCMKRRGSLFRRQTDVCLALEWIEECMESTKWWIHVQSSAEETRLLAPTPAAASLPSRFSEGSVPFSGCGCLLEVVSPTAEDHILECALVFRRIKNDGQLILLSSDVTLKIKAMAEGMICETSEDFRESLVNPFSERFLWADSSPRGPTWSFADDVVLREKYDRWALKKPSKLGEGAKGLKLILLHNSHYGRTSSVN